MCVRAIFYITRFIRPAALGLAVAMAAFFSSVRASSGEEARQERIDLIILATAYIDSIGVSRIEELEYEKLLKLKRTNSVPLEKVQIGSIRLETARKKVEILRGIIEIELERAQSDAKLLRETPDASGKPSLELRRIESNGKILRLLLDSGEPPTRSDATPNVTEPSEKTAP